MFHPSPLALRFTSVREKTPGGQLLQMSSFAVRNDLRAGGELLLISVQVF